MINYLILSEIKTFIGEKMSNKVKSNEEITEEFNEEEELNLQLLQLMRNDIVDVTIKLRRLQKAHKLMTGKNYVLDVI